MGLVSKSWINWHLVCRGMEKVKIELFSNSFVICGHTEEIVRYFKTSKVGE